MQYHNTTLKMLVRAAVIFTRSSTINNDKNLNSDHVPKKDTVEKRAKNKQKRKNIVNVNRLRNNSMKLIEKEEYYRFKKNSHKLVKVFKNGPSKICGRQLLKNLK